MPEVVVAVLILVEQLVVPAVAVAAPVVLAVLQERPELQTPVVAGAGAVAPVTEALAAPALSSSSTINAR
jgi:hypothetical protein